MHSEFALSTHTLNFPPGPGVWGGRLRAFQIELQIDLQVETKPVDCYQHDHVDKLNLIFKPFKLLIK